MVLVSCCISENKKEYVCPDGSVVSSPVYCKKEAVPEPSTTTIREEPSTTVKAREKGMVHPDLPHSDDAIHFIAFIDLGHYIDTAEVQVGFARKKWKLRRSGNPGEFYYPYGRTVQVYPDGKIVLYSGLEEITPAYFRLLSRGGHFRKEVISVLSNSGEITSGDLDRLNEPGEWSLYAPESGKWIYFGFMNPNEITFNFPAKPEHFYIDLKWDEWSDWETASINGHRISKGRDDFVDYVKSGENFFEIGCNPYCSKYDMHSHWILMSFADLDTRITYNAKKGADPIVENAESLTEFWSKYK